MIDIRQVRLVITLAEHGSLVRAGRVLGLSPSALTRAITAIEARVGAELFDRSRRGFEPTPVCRAIILKGSELLARADELAAMVTQLRGGKSDRLIVSAGPFALEAVGSGAIALLLARQPGVQAQLLSGSAGDAVRALLERRAALAIAEVADLDNPEELVVTPLRRHPIFALVRPDHALLALGRGVTEADLFSYPFIVPSYLPARFAPHVSSALAAARANGGGPFFPAIVSDDLAAARDMATRSDAIAVCTASGASSHIRAGTLVPLPWRPDWLETNFGVMRLRSARPTGAIQAIIECVQEADQASLLRAMDLMVAGMTPIAENFAVIGRRTTPALTEASQ